MESQPQNPEFRINSENFHQCLNIFIPNERLACTQNMVNIMKKEDKKWNKYPLILSIAILVGKETLQ